MGKKKDPTGMIVGIAVIVLTIILILMQALRDCGSLPCASGTNYGSGGNTETDY